MKKLVRCFYVLACTIIIATGAMADDDFTYQGEVIGQDIERQLIEIDYQTYQLNLDTQTSGLFKYSEYGAVVPVGSQVEFDTQPVDNGPPLITQIRILSGDQ